jgi:hypothetical protein
VRVVQWILMVLATAGKGMDVVIMDYDRWITNGWGTLLFSASHLFTATAVDMIDYVVNRQDDSIFKCKSSSHYSQHL